MPGVGSGGGGGAAWRYSFPPSRALFIFLYYHTLHLCWCLLLLLLVSVFPVDCRATVPYHSDNLSAPSPMLATREKISACLDLLVIISCASYPR
ncbi:hypothetical protein HOY82DRAFT_559717 [Tuber indicum]|nr:hypothetical protein HOY82DRAFT_559717 [Tuber indicum]